MAPGTGISVSTMTTPKHKTLCMHVFLTVWYNQFEENVYEELRIV